MRLNINLKNICLNLKTPSRLENNIFLNIPAFLMLNGSSEFRVDALPLLGVPINSPLSLEDCVAIGRARVNDRLNLI